ncbi:MAG TPA: hypothetical protein DIT10_19230 [Chryseobacterium sp.]|nr:hypothetical protein [Chryseobacterium sp.]
MKKFLVGILAIGALSSCSTGDDSLPDYNNIPDYSNSVIVGVWKIQTQYQISGKDKTTVISEILPDDCKKKSTYEFRNDGKYVMIDYNTVGSNCEKTEMTTSFQYDPVTMKLIINSQENSVLEASSSKLSYLSPTNQDYNGDGVNDYIKYVYYK